jgi:hypothetical protein
VQTLFDQSLFVEAAIEGVVLEALIAALLTAAMVLLFLGNWRSTLIIALTIPLSILASILLLYALGETLNIMTLGASRSRSASWSTRRSSRSRTSSATCTRRGAERADPGRRGRDRRAGVRLDAVHLHRVRADVLPHRRGALPVRADGRGGVLRDDRLLHPVAHAGADAGDADDAHAGARRASRSTARSTRSSSACARAYTVLARGAAEARALRLRVLAFCALSCLLYPVLGRDFFPSVDAGQIRLHFARRPARASRRRRAWPTRSRPRSAS